MSIFFMSCYLLRPNLTELERLCILCLPLKESMPRVILAIMQLHEQSTERHAVVGQNVHMGELKILKGTYYPRTDCPNGDPQSKDAMSVKDNIS